MIIRYLGPEGNGHSRPSKQILCRFVAHSGGLQLCYRPQNIDHTVTLNPKPRLIPCPIRVQVPNNHILAQNQYYNYYYPKTKYLIIGYLDPLGLQSISA